MPIAPEIEDPEDNWVPGIDPMPSSEDSPHKRGSSEAFKDNSTKKKPKTIDVVLENAPTDEVHPMMSKSSSKDKTNGSKRQHGRQKGKDKGKKWFKSDNSLYQTYMILYVNSWFLFKVYELNK